LKYPGERSIQRHSSGHLLRQGFSQLSVRGAKCGQPSSEQRQNTRASHQSKMTSKYRCR
jgi:hypothetical protein